MTYGEEWNRPENELGYKQKTQKHNWMTAEIMAIFEERRKCKNQGKQCEEIEQLEEVHD